MDDIINIIQELAIKYCSCYPNIENITTYEQLYAIDSTIEGINLANQDCHKIIKYLAKKCNMSYEDIATNWDNIIK